jgi:large subunit ribosomal protein L4
MAVKKQTSKKINKPTKTVASSKKTTKSASDFVIPVVSLDGKSAGTVTLAKEVFDVTADPALIAQAVRVYQINQRQGTAHTKTRGDVTGSGRKIYRQKGTGRARHGDRYAPIFVGGGVAHGPKTRDFNKSLNTAMRRKALLAVLTDKRKNENIVVVDGFEKMTAKTSKMVSLFKSMNFPVKHGKLANSVLVATAGKMDTVFKAGRNITNVSVKEANLLNVYDVLVHKKLVIGKSALDLLTKTFVKS